MRRGGRSPRLRRRARLSDSAGRRLWRFSRRSRSAVSGVRSWWEASATNVRWAAQQLVETSCHRGHRVGECPHLGRAADRLRCDGEVAAGEPCRRRLLSRRTGRVTDRASPHPTTATTTRTTTAMPASAEPEAVDAGVDVAGIERDAQRPRGRRLPTRPARRHRAGRFRACPTIGCLSAVFPASATAISGRVEKSRSTVWSVSTMEMPSRSTTTTRAPVRSRYSSAGTESRGPVASRSSS